MERKTADVIEALCGEADQRARWALALQRACVLLMREPGYATSMTADGYARRRVRIDLLELLAWLEESLPE